MWVCVGLFIYLFKFDKKNIYIYFNFLLHKSPSLLKQLYIACSFLQVKQLVDAAVYESECAQKMICFVAFFADIRDADAKTRTAHIATLKVRRMCEFFRVIGLWVLS